METLTNGDRQESASHPVPATEVQAQRSAAGADDQRPVPTISGRCRRSAAGFDDQRPVPAE